MDHLGVLKVLEQHGIVVDMIAGTSAGAMTGVLYGSGLEGDYFTNQFSADLRSSWIFRRLPRGGRWYLLYKYRGGYFDPMLRQYLDHRIGRTKPAPMAVAVADGRPVQVWFKWLPFSARAPGFLNFNNAGLT